MGVYDSPEEYAKKLNMSIETAKIRIDKFNEIKEEMHKSRKCPKCGEYSLEVEGGEWEAGISDWIYCSNDRIETIDEEGDIFYEECEFTDNVHKKYTFAFEEDFDPVLMLSCCVDINDEQSVLDYIGSTWEEFVKKDTKSLLGENDSSFIDGLDLKLK